MIVQLCDVQREISPTSRCLARIYMHAFVFLGYTDLIDLFSYRRTRYRATHNEFANDIEENVVSNEEGCDRKVADRRADLEPRTRRLHLAEEEQADR